MLSGFSPFSFVGRPRQKLIAPGAPEIPAGFFQEPFDANSAWNKPLTAVGDKTYSLATGFRADQDVPAWSYSHWEGLGLPIYEATESDDLVGVYFNFDNWLNLNGGIWLKQGNSAGIETDIRAGWSPNFGNPYHQMGSIPPANAEGDQVPPTVGTYDPRTDPGSAPRLIRVPSGITMQASTDSLLVIRQPDGTLFESYCTILMNNREICCWTYKLTDPSLGGDGWQNGARASMIPTVSGCIRKLEWDAAEAADLLSEGAPKEAALAAAIPHAIAIYSPPATLENAAVFPALTVDSGALAESPAYAGNNPMGTRIALPAATDIAAMGLWTGPGRAVAYAIRNHGAIIVDRGGDGVVPLSENSITQAFDWPYMEDLWTISQLVEKVVIPSSEFFVSGAGGGGLLTPVFKGFANNNIGNPTVPPHDAGDKLVSIASSGGAHGGVAPSVTTAGWTLWDEAIGSTNRSIAVYRATAAAAGTLCEWTGQNTAASVWVWGDADFDEVATTEAANDTVLDWPALAAMAENCLVGAYAMARAAQTNVDAVALGGFGTRVSREAAHAVWAGDSDPSLLDAFDPANGAFDTASSGHVTAVFSMKGAAG